MLKDSIIKSGFIFALLAGTLIGCSHASLNAKIDREVAQEKGVNNDSDLRKQTGALFENTPGLNDEQRQRLSALRRNTYERTDPLRQESLKLRALLIKDVISTRFDADEVQLIQKKLKALEDKRLAIGFDAVEQANMILGRNAQEYSLEVNGFLDPHGGYGSDY